MNKRSRQFLTVLMCAALASISACSTTTHRLGPSQAAMSHHEIEKGDTVLVRFANAGDARSSSRSEQIRITNISNSGISGIAENGEAVSVGYDEVLQIEYTKVGPIKSDSPALMKTGKAVETISKALLVAACVAAAANGVACPSG